MRRALGRLFLGAGVVVCAAAPWPGLWLSDLLAGLAPLIAVGALALTAAVAITRARRWAAVPLALACSTAVLTLCAPRAPRAAAGAGSLTILVLNANTAPLDETLAFLRENTADIAVLIEAPWKLLRSTPEEAGYHWRLARGPRTGGPGLRAILSRWPGEPAESGFSDEGVFAATLQAPLGPLAVVVAHPESPRTLSRWREGNRRTREAADLASRLERAGARTLVAADFNSPPTGRRSRLLGRAGFRRARPLWPPGGSYPAWAPRVAGLAIDGVAVGRGFSVSSWRVVEAPQGDHRAVLIELAVGGQ